MVNHYLIIKEYWSLLASSDRGEISKELAKYSKKTVRTIQMKFSGDLRFTLKEFDWLYKRLEIEKPTLSLA